MSGIFLAILIIEKVTSGLIRTDSYVRGSATMVAEMFATFRGALGGMANSWVLYVVLLGILFIFIIYQIPRKT
jgi:hypothetical protein